MPEPVTIPISIFELNINYEKPAIRMLSADRVNLVDDLFSSFHEFGPSVDDMEVLTTGKTSEQGIRLKLRGTHHNVRRRRLLVNLSKTEPFGKKLTEFSACWLPFCVL